MKKGNVVVWLKSSQREAFSLSYHKGPSYKQFAEELNKRQNLFFAYDAESYRGDDVFERAYTYRDGEIVPTGKEVIADVIYNLGSIPDKSFKTKNARITNTPEFKQFCLSKSLAAEYLAEFSPQTISIKSEEDFWSALKSIETDTVVFKPDQETNGVGVKIFKKDEAVLDEEMRLHLRKGAIAQAFVNTHSGIPGIAHSYHDLRLITINERIVLLHVRTPESGSLVANYGQGATIREIGEEALPEEVRLFYNKVHEQVKQRFPNPMYSMDIGVGVGGPVLFELNGHTAFPWPEFECRNFFVMSSRILLRSFLNWLRTGYTRSIYMFGDTLAGILFAFTLIGLFLWITIDDHEKSLKVVGRNAFLICLVLGLLTYFM